MGKRKAITTGASPEPQSIEAADINTSAGVGALVQGNQPPSSKGAILDAIFRKACDVLASDGEIGPGLALTCLIFFALHKRDKKIAWSEVEKCWNQPREEIAALLRLPQLGPLAQAFLSCLRTRGWLAEEDLLNDEGTSGLKKYLEGRKGPIMKAEQFGNTPGKWSEVCDVLLRARDRLKASGQFGANEEFAETKLRRGTSEHGIYFEFVQSDRSVGHSTLATRGGRRSAHHGRGPIEFTRGNEREKFARMLAQAQTLTFLGVLHDNLLGILTDAYQKRGRRWEEVRVVFTPPDLLDLVHDQYVETHTAVFDPRKGPTQTDAEKLKEDHKRAVDLRKAILTRARGQLERWLENVQQADGWAFHDYGFFPPFTGTLLEGGDGDALQFSVLHPDGKVDNRVYIHVHKKRGDWRRRSRGEDQAEIYEYYRRIFEKVVEASILYVPKFLTGTLNKAGQFVDGEPASRSDLQNKREMYHDKLLATSLIILIRSRCVLLQKRTPANSTLEHGVQSSVWAYVQPGDLDPKTAKGEVDDPAFERAIRRKIEVDDPAFERAIRRKMLEKFGERMPHPRDFAEETRFTCHPTKPLPRFYHIYSAHFDGEIPCGAGISEWTFDELALLHLYHRLKDATQASFAQTVPPNLTTLRQELILHGKDPSVDDAQLLRDCEVWRDETWDALQRIPATKPDRPSPVERLDQTSDWHLIGPEYTHFWTVFAPLYRKLNVKGAAEFFEKIKPDSAAQAALTALGVQVAKSVRRHVNAASSPPGAGIGG